jgi:hypothetical protein
MAIDQPKADQEGQAKRYQLALQATKPLGQASGIGPVVARPASFWTGDPSKSEKSSLSAQSMAERNQ